MLCTMKHQHCTTKTSGNGASTSPTVVKLYFEYSTWYNVLLGLKEDAAIIVDVVVVVVADVVVVVAVAEPGCFPNNGAADMLS